MPDPSLTDGLIAAAEREAEFHPKTPKGKAITAWKRRADTLTRHGQAIEDLNERVAALEGQPAPHPFP